MDSTTPRTRTLRLHQVIAAEKSVKPKAYSRLTELYHTAQKPDLFNGMSRTYRPKVDGDEVFPGEKKQIEQRVDDLLRSVMATMTQTYDITMQVNRGNQKACADLVVDGEVLLENVPATYLLFLEKQLQDIRALIFALPVLDSSEDWGDFDSNAGAYKTAPVETIKNKKVPRVMVKAEATDRHPAQTEIVHEDLTQGTWVNVKLSAALPARTKRELERRIDELIRAVKEAREDANKVEVESERVGAKLFAYLLQPALGSGK